MTNPKWKTWAVLAIVLIGVAVAWFSLHDPAKPSAIVLEDKVDKTAPIAAGVAFDFYLMALTVHSAFCANGNERKRECRAGGHRSLVIHGLWPERNEPRTWPHDCPAPALDLDPALALEVADFMPGVADGLHEHEWREHGGCSGLDDDEYFRHALRLAHDVDAALGARLTTLGGEETTAAELRSVADMFHTGLGRTITFHCRTLRGDRAAKSYLIEVRQCVDNDGPTGAPGTALDCAAVKRRDQGCGQSFRIAGVDGR